MRRPRPLFRPLKTYAFDPSRGKTLGNFMTVRVPFEELHPGPTGQHLEVVDYDATHDCYYDPVNLQEHDIVLQGGLDPVETDPRFHQQMVYAVASETVRRFSQALGRPVRFQQSERKLRIFPHAFQQANAFYSRDQHALLFGYF